MDGWERAAGQSRSAARMAASAVRYFTVICRDPFGFFRPSPFGPHEHHAFAAPLAGARTTFAPSWRRQMRPGSDSVHAGLGIGASGGGVGQSVAGFPVSPVFIVLAFCHRFCHTVKQKISGRHRKMRLGYIRIDKAGPSRSEQEAALRAAGVEDFSPDGPVYVDQPPARRPAPGADATPARTSATRALRSGDEIAIHSAGRLGTTRDDVLRALAAVTAQGGAVWDCERGETVRFHPGAEAAISFAERAESQGKRQRAAKARQGITRRPGRGPALAGKKLKEAEALWKNPETTARQVAEATGASARTLYRLFGPKGTPIFGKRPAK